MLNFEQLKDRVDENVNALVYLVSSIARTAPAADDIGTQIIGDDLVMEANEHNYGLEEHGHASWEPSQQFNELLQHEMTPLRYHDPDVAYVKTMLSWTMWKRSQRMLYFHSCVLERRKRGQAAFQYGADKPDDSEEATSSSHVSNSEANIALPDQY
jgi:hypothetical protein